MLKSSGMQTILPQSMEEEAKMHSSDFAQAVLQLGWGGGTAPSHCTAPAATFPSSHSCLSDTHTHISNPT